MFNDLSVADHQAHTRAHSGHELPFWNEHSSIPYPTTWAKYKMQ